MPDAAPVTTATFPTNVFVMLFLWMSLEAPATSPHGASQLGRGVARLQDEDSPNAAAA